MNKLFSPDARLFGLPIWRKRLTDAEYIEHVRKQLRLYRWVRVLYGLIGIGTVIICIWIIRVILDMIVQVGVAPAQQPILLGAVSIAIFVGFNVGWMIYGAIHGSMMMIVDSRRDRLLVECWDLLHQLIAERDAAAGGLGPI